MINPLLLPLKQKLIISGFIVALAAGGVTAALSQPAKTGADTSPIVQQVNHNTDELANHEARITNTENDVKDLQDKTNTTPSTVKVDVPPVTSQAATAPITDTTPVNSPPAPAPITVKQVAYSTSLMGDTHCILYYSDGSQANASVDAPGNCSSYMEQVKN